MRYQIGSRYLPFELDETMFLLKPGANRVDPTRVFMRCPGCDSPKRALFYKQTWACGDCLQLRFRSQLVDPDVLVWERIDEITSVIGQGKPLGMWQKTYQAFEAELAGLRAQLGKRPRPQVSTEHSYVMHAIWRSMEDSGADLSGSFF